MWRSEGAPWRASAAQTPRLVLGGLPPPRPHRLGVGSTPGIRGGVWGAAAPSDSQRLPPHLFWRVSDEGGSTPKVDDVFDFVSKRPSPQHPRAGRRLIACTAQGGWAQAWLAGFYPCTRLARSPAKSPPPIRNNSTTEFRATIYCVCGLSPRPHGAKYSTQSRSVEIRPSYIINKPPSPPSPSRGGLTTCFARGGQGRGTYEPQLRINRILKT